MINFAHKLPFCANNQKRTMLKTRDKLIDIARQLFAHKGIENTTMNDIAIAAEKGRRTIYTYFKNKRDIYNAVIESESEIVLKRLKDIAALPIPADQKLMEFIFQRFEAMKDLVFRNGSLRAGFFRDIRKVERARKAGINVPIIPGIKPFTKLSQISMIPKTFKVDLPEELASEAIKCRTDQEARILGTEWCIYQCRELIEQGVPSIHFYTVGAVESVRDIAREIY